MSISVRQMHAADFSAIIELCEAVYPGAPTWAESQLSSHFTLFPEGQLVAVEDERVLGYAACLIVNWDDYTFQDSWRAMTFANKRSAPSSLDGSTGTTNYTTLYSQLCHSTVPLANPRAGPARRPAGRAVSERPADPGPRRHL